MKLIVPWKIKTIRKLRKMEVRVLDFLLLRFGNLLISFWQDICRPAQLTY